MSVSHNTAVFSRLSSKGRRRGAGRWKPVGVALSLVVAAGCTSDAPDKFTYWGKVTIGGKPCPVCELGFDPDPARGGSGPGAIVYAQNGEYRTEKDYRITPGPKSVRIIGFDGVPTPDCEYGTVIIKSGVRIAVDLPTHDAEQNFDIPADALVKK